MRPNIPPRFVLTDVDHFFKHVNGESGRGPEAQLGEVSLMSRNTFRPWLRRAFVAAAFGTVLVGASVPAHAFNTGWWWPFRPNTQPVDHQPTPVPEIDPGMMRGTLTVLVGGVLVLLARRRRR